jgi:two-component system, OmpR family, sensor kinase
MRFSLRVRLFASYLVLLAVSLGVIVAALLVFLDRRPVPPQQTYQQLLSIAGALRLREMLLDATSPDTAGADSVVGAFASELTQFAAERDVRVLIVDIPSQTVRFDTAGQFSTGDPIYLREEAYTVTAQQRRGIPIRVNLFFGSFTDPGQSEWIFTELTAARSGIMMDVGSRALLLADPPQDQSLQGALAEFGPALILPLAQSALAGLVVASILAILISRTIAKPLQAVAKAATSVAEGYYSLKAPDSGPKEVRAVAEAFNYMSAQVQATQQAQQDFLANVSHDLKTPLTSIQGFSQAIMDGAVSDPVQAAKIIYEEAGRLNRMVVQLTDLARLQAGRLSMRTTAVDVAQIAEVVAQRLAIVAKEKGVTLDIRTASVPEVAGDGDRLAQVFTNLLSNAIKFTPSGGCVQIKTQVNRGGVEVIVQDDGIGIPAKELPRIFDRFYQVDKSRGPARGTGLGLAIVREIIQAHGGKISVSSAGEGQGATFTVWLPSPQLSTVVRGKR